MAQSKVARLSGNGEFETDVRGESHYQNAIELLCKNRPAPQATVHAVAVLILEDDNPGDPNAVRVDIQGHTVGYLSREVAAGFRRVLGGRRWNGTLECNAVINGGFQRRDQYFPYGVRLDLPDDFLTADTSNLPKTGTAPKKGGGCLRWILIGIGVFIGLLVALAVIGAPAGG